MYQLNALVSLYKFANATSRMTMYNSFINSNFQVLSNDGISVENKKGEKDKIIHKLAFRMIYRDYDSS